MQSISRFDDLGEQLYAGHSLIIKMFRLVYRDTVGFQKVGYSRPYISWGKHNYAES